MGKNEEKKEILSDTTQLMFLYGDLSTRRIGISNSDVKQLLKNALTKYCKLNPNKLPLIMEIDDREINEHVSRLENMWKELDHI